MLALCNCIWDSLDLFPLFKDMTLPQRIVSECEESSHGYLSPQGFKISKTVI